MRQLSQKEMLKLQDTLIGMKEQASEDPIYFTDTFLYTFNPRVNPSNIRFKLFPFQKRLVRDILFAVRNGEDLFIDKTRDMGVTYTVLATFLWMWLFEPGSNFLLGSRKEDYVDNRRGGTTGNKEESLFGKIDYMLSRLPPFMLPNEFNRERHFNFMSLVNPENGNAISGESANLNFSRGSRHRAIFLDEFAFWDFGDTVWGSTADTTNCRIVATTPGVKPSKAKRLRFNKDGEKIKVITLNYNLDPRKNQKWLEEQRERRSQEDFNREIMVNWETSITGRVYPEMDNASYGEFPFLVGQPLYCSWDFGLDGTAMLFVQINPANGKPRLIDSFVADGERRKTIPFFLPFFNKPISSEFDYTDDDLKAIADISKLPPAIHFGDPDVNKASYHTGVTTRQILAQAGVFVQSVTPNDFFTRREKTKVWLQKGFEINANHRNEYVYEALKSYRYPAREETSQATTPILKPIHDWCLAGETKIRTLNGWHKIEDLVGKDFYVWGYSEKFKRLIPTKAKRCWKTKSNTKTIKVWMDHGSYVRCTPNHRFMLRDGTYKEAQDLMPGESLMPFYENENHKDYVSVYLNDGSKGPEHRIVYNWFNGHLLQDHHIHHINGIKNDNNPENLEQITKEEHCRITKPQTGTQISQSLKLYFEKNRALKTCPTCKKQTMMTYKQKFCSKSCSSKWHGKIKQMDKMTREAEDKICVVCRELFKAFPRQKTCSSGCAAIRKRNYINLYALYHKKGEKIDIHQADQHFFQENHKVLKIEFDNKEVDVYDIEVPETHNFVAEGVVVHNCSHPSTAFEYLCMNIDSYKSHVEQKPDWASKIGRYFLAR